MIDQHFDIVKKGNIYKYYPVTKNRSNTMTELKNAAEMHAIAMAFSQDKLVKDALTKLQPEIYNAASSGKFHLITETLTPLNNKQLRIVIDKLKSLGYNFEFVSRTDQDHKGRHKISWELDLDGDAPSKSQEPFLEDLEELSCPFLS